MTLRLRFSEHALTQLEEAIARIAADDPGAAQHLVAAIEGRLEQLRRFPDSGRAVPEVARTGLREVIVPPYRVIYRHEATSIHIIAVVHGRRLLEPALPEGED